MLRNAGWLAFTTSTLVITACAAETGAPKADEGELATFAVTGDTGAADGHGPYQGELALDVIEMRDLTHRTPYHTWLFEGTAGDAVFIDLASRDGDDMLVMLYVEGEHGWDFVDYNDDCYPGRLNSCLEATLEHDRDYLVLATTYRYGYFRRPTPASYHLTLHCRSGSCAGAEGRACGSRGLEPCPSGYYCDWPDDSCGAVDAPGVCRVMSDICPEIYAPVCGCDGNTYSNACFAGAAGADVAHSGECEEPGGGEGELCGGIAGIACQAGLECDYSANDFCGADLAGTCVSVELIACTREYRPVCGCDGRTYGNDCERRAARVALDHTGACESVGGEVGDTCGGIAGLTCRSGLVCDYSGNVWSGAACPADEAGVCAEEIEILCTAEYRPVCGCDGRTYSNDCHRRAARASLAYEGACR